MQSFLLSAAARNRDGPLEMVVFERAMEMSLPSHIKDAIDTYVPSLGDWLDVSRAYEMAQLILDEKPEVVVELGTFKGQSMLTQAFALRENNFGCLYSIDPWKQEFAVEGMNSPENNEWWTKAINLAHIHQGCMQTIWDHHLDPWVVVIRAASQYVYQMFPHNISVLYVDANHSELASCRDVENYAARVQPNGAIWIDDCQWPSTQKALAILDSMCSLEKDGGSYRLYRKL